MGMSAATFANHLSVQLFLSTACSPVASIESSKMQVLFARLRCLR
jgi:hypothetical protein